MIGRQGFDGQRRLGLSVADGVAFVEDEVVEVKLAEESQQVNDVKLVFLRHRRPRSISLSVFTGQPSLVILNE